MYNSPLNIKDCYFFDLFDKQCKTVDNSYKVLYTVYTEGVITNETNYQ